MSEWSCCQAGLLDQTMWCEHGGRSCSSGGDCLYEEALLNPTTPASSCYLPTSFHLHIQLISTWPIQFAPRCTILIRMCVTMTVLCQRGVLLSRERWINMANSDWRSFGQGIRGYAIARGLPGPGGRTSSRRKVQASGYHAKVTSVHIAHSGQDGWTKMSSAHSTIWVIGTIKPKSAGIS